MTQRHDCERPSVADVTQSVRGILFFFLRVSDCVACVLSAYLGTLDFTLLFDQENNCLHCTIHKAKVREISKYPSRTIGAPPPLGCIIFLRGPDQKQLLCNAFTAAQDVRQLCRNLVKVAPLFARPRPPASRRKNKVTLRQNVSDGSSRMLFVCGGGWDCFCTQGHKPCMAYCVPSHDVNYVNLGEQFP